MPYTVLYTHCSSIKCVFQTTSLTCPEMNTGTHATLYRSA